MSPRKRNIENTGLPKRWRLTHGAYYYQVPPGLETLWDGKKLFRLGKTLPEAYRTWSARLETTGDDIRTIGQLLDRYLLEVVPSKPPKVQTDNTSHIKNLRAVFADQPLTLKPRFIYKYVELRSKKKINANGKMTGGKTIAHREVETLSHAFTKAVEWGVIDRHPFKGEVRLEGAPPRDRYIEDWEIIECLALESRRKKGSVLAIQAYIRLKLMTGMARSDLLRLTAANIKETGIHIQRHKTASSTGKRTIYEWDDDVEPSTGKTLPGPLRRAVQQAIAVRPALSPFLFCNRAGAGYYDEQSGEAHGWDSMWQRFMVRVLKDTKVTERFTEHDLRAKCASDAETLAHARALLSHADEATTRRIYRRKPERVKPLKGVVE
jgi:integrase